MTVSAGGPKKGRSATLKVAAISLLVLLLQIPGAMISSLMQERALRRHEAVQEINSKWGAAQTLAGPFFTIPYRISYKDQNNNQRSEIKYLHVLPEQLTVSGQIEPEIRRRGIYEAVLYKASLTFSGSFAAPDLTQLTVPSEEIFWDKAIFSVGISDLRGISEQITLTFGGQSYNAAPGLKTEDIARAGVSSTIPLKPGGGPAAFSFLLKLKGSEQMQFVPLAKETLVAVSSPWPSPSLNGAFLPVSREVSAQGFSAAWKVLHLNRNYPQAWLGDRYKVDDSAFGFTLLITADIYQQGMRIAKYALIFIVFTFAAFFLSEIINSRPLHPIQYLLIGLAVVMFYILLLSISEQISFDCAYLLSAAAVTFLITSYSQGILKSARFSLTICAVLSTLYTYLYIVLQLEDYALLMGALGLFAVLAAIMHLTRSVDWYNLGGKET